MEAVLGGEKETDTRLSPICKVETVGYFYTYTENETHVLRGGRKESNPAIGNMSVT